MSNNFPPPEFPWQRKYLCLRHRRVCLHSPAPPCLLHHGRVNSRGAVGRGGGAAPRHCWVGPIRSLYSAPRLPPWSWTVLRSVLNLPDKPWWWPRSRSSPRWSTTAARTRRSRCPPTTAWARDISAWGIRCTASKGASPNRARTAGYHLCRRPVCTENRPLLPKTIGGGNQKFLYDPK